MNEMNDMVDGLKIVDEIAEKTWQLINQYSEREIGYHLMAKGLLFGLFQHAYSDVEFDEDRLEKAFNAFVDFAYFVHMLVVKKKERESQGEES